MSVKGDAALEDFRANTTGKGAESLGEELLSWKALNVPGIDFTMAPGTATQVQVREAALSDFYARLIVNPQGRLIAPAEVTATALWLCGPGSQGINGQAISIAGGEI